MSRKSRARESFQPKSRPSIDNVDKWTVVPASDGSPTTATCSAFRAFTDADGWSTLSVSLVGPEAEAIDSSEASFRSGDGFAGAKEPIGDGSRSPPDKVINELETGT